MHKHAGIEAVESMFRAHHSDRHFSGAYTTVGDLDLFIPALLANKLFSDGQHADQAGLKSTIGEAAGKS
ncbi:MAG: hypothetical protein VB144_06540 [Clostridia bacterium]|nr:hypothetical protein [Clostridia bacterium]